MTIYFISIIVSLTITIGTQPLLQNKITRTIASILVAIPTAYIAGVRDLTIGTDIRNYGLFNFTAAGHFSNFFDYYNFIQYKNGTEIGYAFLNFLVSRFTDNISFFFFFLSLLTIGVVYWAIVNYHKILNTSIIVSFTIFYMLFYGPSLNIMRQSVAASFVFLSFSYLIKGNTRKKEYFYFIVYSLLAISFHTTAVITFVILLVFYICFSLKSKTMKALIVVVAGSFILLLSTLSIPKVYSIIGSISFFEKYLLYTGNIGSMVYEWSVVEILRYISVPLILVLVYYIFYLTKTGNIIGELQIFQVKAAQFFSIILVIGAFFTYFQTISMVLGRLGIYFTFFQIVGYPYLMGKLLKPNSKWFGNAILIIYVIYIFIHVTSGGSGEIYPYTSQILQNLSW